MAAMWTPCFEDLLQFDELEFVKLADFTLNDSIMAKFVTKKKEEGEEVKDKLDNRLAQSSSERTEDFHVKGPQAQTDPEASSSVAISIGMMGTAKTYSTNRKPSMCHLCGKQYTNSGSLISHMYVHTGQDPYSCKLCPMTFRYHSRLKEHMKIHASVKDVGEGKWKDSTYKEEVFFLHS